MADVMVMTAQELLDKLLRLRAERSDFANLGVYVEVVDQGSYHAEQHAIEDEPGVTTIETTIVGEGSAYALHVHTPVDREGKQGEDYILIAAVEFDDDE